MIGTTEKAIKLAEEQIKKHKIEDEDLKQEIYLLYLTEENPQARHSKFIKLLQKFDNEQQERYNTLMGVEYLGRVPYEEPSSDDIADIAIIGLCNNAFDELHHKQANEILNDMLQELTDMQRSIIDLRFKEKLTLEDISKMQNTTREVIRQKEARALRELRRQCLNRELRDALMELLFTISN